MTFSLTSALILLASPLRSEADNWCLRELRGRYDMLLQYVARHPGCDNASILAAISNLSRQEGKQAGGYLKVLTERYWMIERRMPIFARPKARSGRYYICDNFLRSWLIVNAAVYFRGVLVHVFKMGRLRKASDRGFNRSPLDADPLLL